MTDVFNHDEAVRSAVEAYIEAHDLTLGEASNRIKLSSSTRLAKYLALNKPGAKSEPDMPRVESAIRHFLRHQARREAMASSLFETSVARSVANTIKEARKIGDMALIHGPAGSGKTCGGELYCRNNPNSLMITASKDRRDGRAVRNLVFDELRFDRDAKGRSYSGYGPRWEWIVNVLNGSERVIIVDNAQRLALSALEWFADLNDQTNTTIAYLGNPEVLHLMRRSDQLSSRIGIVTEVKIHKDEQAIATRLVEQYAPEGNGALCEAVVGLVGEAGHARRARKHLQLCHNIKSGKPDLSWPDAFRLAESKLLKPNPNASKK